MDSPESVTSRATGRSSVIESIRGCTMAGMRISKEELRLKITMPQYLRLAMRDAIQSKDVTAGNRHYASTAVAGEAAQPPESPLVVFINSRSGGRHGPELKARLQDLMGEEQVALSLSLSLYIYIYICVYIGIVEHKSSEKK
ncbi:hypothetical protein CsSME_00008483 [Camellia sinensis var. sinensis]